MPDAPKQPVTVEDLWVQYVPNPPLDDMPDLRPATVADLVSALPDDAETIDLVVDWLWGKVANKKVKRIRKALDALAEAQPFPPAGG